MAQRQIVNGGWMDALGNPLNGGTLKMRLNTDAVVGATGPQVCAGTIISVPLGATGSVSGTVDVWPNDQLSPSTTVYVATVYTAEGQVAWQGQQTVTSGVGAFDLNSWVPSN